MYAILKKYLLPKEISKLREEIKEQKEYLLNKIESDLGYEIISWWDSPLCQDSCRLT